MKKLVLGAAALAAMAAPAFAADMQPRPYTKAPAYTAPQVVYNWTGFYVGGHVGGGWTGGDNGQSGFVGGGQIGFNYQVGQWVLGVEGDIAATSIKDSASVTVFVPGVGVGFAHGEASLDWISTFAGRFGWTFDRWLVYGKLGGAWAHVSADAFASMNGFGALPLPTLI